MQGTVVAVHSGGLYRVQCDAGHEVLAQLSGRKGPAASHAPQTRPSGSPVALDPTPCDLTPRPFTALGLDARLLEGVRDLGFVETRPIQSAVIPLALARQDLIACA